MNQDDNGFFGKDKANEPPEPVSNIDLVKKQRQSLTLLREDPFYWVRRMQESFSQNPVKLTAYRPNSLELEADVGENGYIIVNDSYFPGWQAKIDGKSTRIFQANHAFRAVRVNAGKHKITMSYKPQAFYLGIRISAVSFFLLTTILLRLSIRKQHIPFGFIPGFLSFARIKKSKKKGNGKPRIEH
jgi:uncharacterized membrane protein YfhO